MNILFKKNTEGSEVFIVKNSIPESFDYIKMIKLLINGENLEASRFEGDYSEEEILKVNEMVEKIKETISTEKGSNEESYDLPDELFSKSVAFESDDEEIRVENIPF
jgi:hypothetical protein